MPVLKGSFKGNPDKSVLTLHFIQLINSTVTPTSGFALLTETFNGQIVPSGTLM